MRNGDLFLEDYATDDDDDDNDNNNEKDDKNKNIAFNDLISFLILRFVTVLWIRLDTSRTPSQLNTNLLYRYWFY